MRNEQVQTFGKRFLQENAYQLFAAGLAFVLTLIAAYVSFQLFQQNTTMRVQALESTMSTQQQILNQLIVNQAINATNLQNLNTKATDIKSDVQEIKNYLLNNK